MVDPLMVAREKPGTIDGVKTGMRRIDLYAATKNIATATDESGLMEFLGKYVGRGNDTPGTAELMGVFREFTLLSAGFTNAERQILSIFGLGELLDAAFWAQLMSMRLEKKKERIRKIIDNWKTYSAIMPGMIGLIVPDEKVFDEVIESGPSSHLSIVLFEASGETSRPERIEAMLEAMRLLHDFARRFYGPEDSTLSIAFCDSGSDKEFIFTAAEKVIGYLKAILVSVWDKVILYREVRAEKRIQVVSAALPVLSEIEFRRAALGAENAKILEHAVMEAVGKLIDTGAVPRDIEQLAGPAARQLAAPQPKLITHIRPPAHEKRPARKKKPRKS